MSLKLSVYNKLVNEVPGIREKYLNYKRSQKRSSFSAFAYLAYMNFQYHILRRKSVGEAFRDEKIVIRPGFSESAVINYGTPQEFADRLMEYDVISFDVFDTLVFRPFKKPTDLFFFLDKEFNYPGLKKLRMDAEGKVRSDKKNASGRYEVDLKEIWDLLEQESGIASSEGCQKEFYLEKKFCYANPFFKEVNSI